MAATTRQPGRRGMFGAMGWNGSDTDGLRALRASLEGFRSKKARPSSWRRLQEQYAIGGENIAFPRFQGSGRDRIVRGNRGVRFGFRGILGRRPQYRGHLRNAAASRSEANLRLK